MSVAEGKVVGIQERSAAAPSVERLDWDSKFFGARMGRIVPAGEAAASPVVTRLTLARARNEGFDHVILRLSAGDFDGMRAAESAGMSLVDVAIDLARPAEGCELGEVRAGTEDDLPWARDLAGRAFVHSRFFSDPFFSLEQGKAFHREWVKNLWGGLATHLLVAVADGRNAGFIACSQNGNEGRIVLIATDERARGRGIGRALVHGALTKLAASGAETVRVKTQASNIAALNLYERSGFAIAASELTYSWASNEGHSR
jgi:dTDP-4-amino-4,6-dideoxy-D-galactose acyltransferase